MDLLEFVQYHTTRGECTCGKCFDVKDVAPLPALFGAHTVNMEFFKVAFLNAPAKDEFVRLTKEHHGNYNDVNPLDGQEHSYLELGDWICDQGDALLYMALGVHLGVFQLMSPRVMIPGISDDDAKSMAGQGFVIVKVLFGHVRSPEEQAAHDAAQKTESLNGSIPVICSTAAQDFNWDHEKMVHVLIAFIDEKVRDGTITTNEFHEHIMAAKT